MRPFVIGFGYKAKSGKDLACQAIMDAYSKHIDVRCYAFADVIRRQLDHELRDWYYAIGRDPASDLGQEGMRYLCQQAGVPYDEDGTKYRDRQYPYGKQRLLTQWKGQAMRREEHSVLLRETNRRMVREHPRVALISDVRKEDEFDFIDFKIKMVRPGFIIPAGSDHRTEVELDRIPDACWDAIITAATPAEVEFSALRAFELACAVRRIPL
jgi:hypothetical protein